MNIDTDPSSSSCYRPTRGCFFVKHALTMEQTAALSAFALTDRLQAGTLRATTPPRAAPASVVALARLVLDKLVTGEYHRTHTLAIRGDAVTFLKPGYEVATTSFCYADISDGMAAHTDWPQPSPKGLSNMTLLMYGGAFCGGELSFLDLPGRERYISTDFEVEPGDAALFNSDLFHCSKPVTAGSKMYARVPVRGEWEVRCL